MARSFSSFPDWNVGRTVVKYRYHRAKGAAAMRYTLMHKEIPVLDMDFLAKAMSWTAGWRTSWNMKNRRSPRRDRAIFVI